jgi:hypothetical protein
MGVVETWGGDETERGGYRMSEKELLEEIFELALQYNMDYLG